MGGFGLSYVASTEQLVFTADPLDPGGGLVQTPTSYRVDDDRTLIVWNDIDFSGRVRAVVVDGSTAPALTIGALVEFQARIFATISAVQLDTDNWLMYYLQGATVPDIGFSYQRFSISGVTISLGTYEEHQATWEQDVPAIPDAFYEGHADGVGGETNVTYSVGGAMSGIDIDHVIVDATLEWATIGFQSEPKLAIMDLTTNLPVASYNAAALGYTPGSLAAFGTPGEGPAYAEPGMSYRVGVDGSSNPVVAQVEATSSTTLVATVTNLPSSFIADNGFLGAFSRAPDGTLWTWFGERTFHTWTTSAPVDGHWTIYSILGAVATSYSYSFENTASEGAANTVPAGPSGLMVGGYSWQIDDTHMRMDRKFFVNLAPHQTLTSPPFVYGGTSVDGYIVMAYQQGSSPARAYVALAQEVPLVPEARFTFDPKLVTAPLTPVAFDGTPLQSGVNPGDTDYYWHPIVAWHWEYDDTLTQDTVTPTTTHTYLKKSTTHVAGSQVTDVPSPLPHNWATTGYYLPVLIVTDTLGHASPPLAGLYLHDFFEDRVQVTVDSYVPQRQFPRDDGLGISTKRSWPPPTTKQFGLRRGAVNTVE